MTRLEPQAAYSAFTAGFKHKLTYFIRTIPDIKTLLTPIDDVIDENLIPALTEGQILNFDDRAFLSLPVRLGGLGIPIFSKLSEEEYANSKNATETLVKKIVRQDSVYVYDKARDNEVNLNIKKKREKYQNDLLEQLRSRMSKEKIRSNDIARMKGTLDYLIDGHAR